MIINSKHGAIITFSRTENTLCIFLGHCHPDTISDLLAISTSNPGIVIKDNRERYGHFSVALSPIYDISNVADQIKEILRCNGVINIKVTADDFPAKVYGIGFAIFWIIIFIVAIAKS